MAINNFKPFALDPNANVTSQADWEALPALLSGFTAGKASSAQVNKAIRQASFIAAALAQYTANKSGLDVLDDGDLNGFISKMGTAFGKDFQALDATLTALAGLATGENKLPYFTGNDTAAQTDLTSVGRDIIGKSTIADILTYLRLYDIINPTTNRQTVVYDPAKKNCLVIRENGQWGAEVVESGEVIPLPVSRGGTGGRNKAESLKNLGLGDGTGRLVKCQVFKTSGTYTPTPGTTFSIVEMVGGGGAGGGCLVGTNSNAACGGGGMSGEYVKARVDNPVATTVTIGAGGIGTSAAVGQHGGATSFGADIVALGGLGGNLLSEGTSPGIVGPYGSYFVPGFTGANIYGSGCGYNSPGIRISGSFAIGGPGGSSVLGAGAGAQAIVGEGINANGHGGGGSGACVYGGSTQQRAGGAGMAGIVIVWEYA
ncbi:hypothetical protein ACSD0F_001532 [Escherichia coli]